MSNPSLLCVPYRFKTSKLYSQIPDSGLGDFTVTRSASNSATRVNAAGFIETVADNVPRLDYPLGGITAGCPALLVEPSGQNLAFYSEQFDNAYWSKLRVNTSNWANQEIAPNNTLTAEKLTQASGETQAGVVFRSLTVSSGQAHTFSVFAKKGSRDFVALFSNLTGPTLGAYFNINNGTVGTISAGYSAKIENYGNGWFRCSITATSNSTSHIFFIYGVSANNTLTVPDDGGFQFIWGAQVETGSVATSYIPTTTAAITRGAEVVSKTGISSLIGQTEGTIYIECQSEFATNDIIVINTAGQSPGNNYVSITKTPTNVFRLTLIASGTTILIDQTSAITSFAKIAVAYASGNTALFINGTQIGSTDTTGFSFNAALNNITFISNMVSGTKTTRIRALALYPNRLTNAQLQSLTQ